MTMSLADPNVTERPPIPEGSCMLCGSRHYWWRPGFRLWVCGGCALPTECRFGVEWVDIAWTQAEWDEWGTRPENQQAIANAIQHVRDNGIKFLMYDALGIVRRANAPKAERDAESS